MSHSQPQEKATTPSPPIWQMGILFATIYAVQGINEPGNGLAAIPTRKLLDENLGRSLEQITGFMAVVSYPWAIKPLYGLVSDFLPLFGSHRKSYLMLMSFLAGVAFLLVALLPDLRQNSTTLLLMLLIPGLATAFCDVVTDGLMVQTCQPIGRTGSMQSVQWTALYAASIWASWYGGRLAKDGNYTAVMLYAAAAAFVAMGVTLFFAHEAPSRSRKGEFVHTLRALLKAFVSPVVVPAAVFLFCWHFNPFSSAVYQYFQTHTLGFDEGATGQLEAINYAAKMVGVFMFGQYCRRISFRAIVHFAIALGVLGNLAYVLVNDYRSAVVAAILDGFATGTASLMVLDVAARMVPPAVAGTVFALLMACANQGINMGILVGGKLDNYFQSTLKLNATDSFHLLVLVAAGFTAVTWVVVPWLMKQQPLADQMAGENS